MESLLKRNLFWHIYLNINNSVFVVLMLAVPTVEERSTPCVQLIKD